MKISRRTEITVETRRTLIIRNGRPYRLDRCAECGAQAQMTTANEAAILAGVSPRAIYQLIEARKLHFVEMPDGVVLICPNSLEICREG